MRVKEAVFIFILLQSVWPLLKRGKPPPLFPPSLVFCLFTPLFLCTSFSCSSPPSWWWIWVAVEVFEVRPQQREQLLCRLFECAATSPPHPPACSGSDGAVRGHTARLQLPRASGDAASDVGKRLPHPPTPSFAPLASLTHTCLGFGVLVTAPLLSPFDHNSTPPFASLKYLS